MVKAPPLSTLPDCLASWHSAWPALLSISSTIHSVGSRARVNRLREKDDPTSGEKPPLLARKVCPRDKLSSGEHRVACRSSSPTKTPPRSRRLGSHHRDPAGKVGAEQAGSPSDWSPKVARKRKARRASWGAPGAGAAGGR